MDENEKKELMENPDKEHLEEAEKERGGERLLRSMRKLTAL